MLWAPELQAALAGREAVYQRRLSSMLLSMARKGVATYKTWRVD